MAAKRKTLREKTASRPTGSKKNNNVQHDLPEDPQAFLHEYKESKKDKLVNKKNEFLTKLAAKPDNAISKSSLRRRKRKAKEDLKPKLRDLLTSLEQTTETSESSANTENKPASASRASNINIVESSTAFVKNRKNNKNIPNAKNKSGAKIIETQERERFGQVLKYQGFKKSPFASLRESIANRLQNDGI